MTEEEESTRLAAWNRTHRKVHFFFAECIGANDSTPSFVGDSQEVLSARYRQHT